MARAVRVNQTLPHGVGDHLRAILHVQLVEDVAQVVLDGVLRDHQAIGELTVRRDAGDE